MKTILFVSEYSNFRRDIKYTGNYIFGSEFNIEVFDNCKSIDKILGEGVKDIAAIIVSDDMGPNKKLGEYIIEKYRKNGRYKGVPSFFLVCRGTESDGEKAKKLGANDYLVTPCSLTEFGPMFKEHYGKYAAQKEQAHLDALEKNKKRDEEKELG